MRLDYTKSIVISGNLKKLSQFFKSSKFPNVSFGFLSRVTQDNIWKWKENCPLNLWVFYVYLLVVNSRISEMTFHIRSQFWFFYKKNGLKLNLFNIGKSGKFAAECCILNEIIFKCFFFHLDWDFAEKQKKIKFEKLENWMTSFFYTKITLSFF